MSFRISTYSFFIFLLTIFVNCLIYAQTWNLDSQEKDTGIITLENYACFLNDVASRDSYGLYPIEMELGSDSNLVREGRPGDYHYLTKKRGEPLKGLSPRSAALYCYWLQNKKENVSLPSIENSSDFITFLSSLFCGEESSYFFDASNLEKVDFALSSNLNTFEVFTSALEKQTLFPAASNNELVTPILVLVVVAVVGLEWYEEPFSPRILRSDSIDTTPGEAVSGLLEESNKPFLQEKWDTLCKDYLPEIASRNSTHLPKAYLELGKSNFKREKKRTVTEPHKKNSRRVQFDDESSNIDSSQESPNDRFSQRFSQGKEALEKMISDHVQSTAKRSFQYYQNAYERAKRENSSLTAENTTELEDLNIEEAKIRVKKLEAIFDKISENDKDMPLYLPELKFWIRIWSLGLPHFQEWEGNQKSNSYPYVTLTTSEEIQQLKTQILETIKYHQGLQQGLYYFSLELPEVGAFYITNLRALYDQNKYLLDTLKSLNEKMDSLPSDKLMALTTQNQEGINFLNQDPSSFIDFEERLSATQLLCKSTERLLNKKVSNPEIPKQIYLKHIAKNREVLGYTFLSLLPEEQLNDQYNDLRIKLMDYYTLLKGIARYLDEDIDTFLRTLYNLANQLEQFE